ncbi:MAG: YraN family protein [Gallionella sp.]
MNGAQAERWAADYLQGQGLKPITQNFHSRFGEIDLIMQDNSALVFIEVRQRSHADYGGAAASIDKHKQQRLIRTAQYYLAKLDHTPMCRFDVVLMDDTNGLNVQWLKNAFDA